MVEYRQLGGTGIAVSKLSIGGATLGNVYGEVATAQAIEAVRFAIDQGVNYVDTSPYYGRSLSERRLGEALQDGYRNRVVLATKAGRRGDGVFDYSHDGILRSWEASAERLGVSRFDVFQLHDVEFVPVNEVIEQAWPAMVRLKSEGLVGHIGITGYPLQHLARLITDLDPRPEVVLTYCHYNLLNTTFDDWLLPAASHHGIGVVNASVTHMGVLTDSGGPPWHPAPSAVHRIGRRLSEHARARGTPLTDVALRFAARHPAIATTCVGMRSVEEVAQNLAAIQQPDDDSLLSELRLIIGGDADLNWIVGKPEYNDPGSVPGRPSVA